MWTVVTHMYVCTMSVLWCPGGQMTVSCPLEMQLQAVRAGITGKHGAIPQTLQQSVARRRDALGQKPVGSRAILVLA